MGILAPGERSIATTNRNFRGRMGSGESEVCLANAWVAAAAAVTGEIVRSGRRSRGRARVILPGTRGRDRQDDVDTDVLFPGPYLSITDVAQMPQYLFEGLDPSLRDQLVGPTRRSSSAPTSAAAPRASTSRRRCAPRASSSSSARSFARIFSRNCLNLGLPIVICAEAVDAAKPGDQLELDLAAGTLTVAGVAYEVPALPPFMRELLGQGGLVEMRSAAELTLLPRSYSFARDGSASSSSQALSDEMEYGTIARWLKREGDSVDRGRGRRRGRGREGDDRDRGARDRRARADRRRRGRRDQASARRSRSSPRAADGHGAGRRDRDARGAARGACGGSAPSRSARWSSSRRS